MGFGLIIILAIFGIVIVCLLAEKIIQLVSKLFRRVVGHKCVKCKKSMKFVPDEHETKFLKKSQAVEREMGSADYEVFVCLDCKTVC